MNKEKLESLHNALQEVLGTRIQVFSDEFDEISIVIAREDYLETMQLLRASQQLAFESLLDLCAIDYLEYPEKKSSRCRFAIVVHLLSLSKNWRLRVLIFIEEVMTECIPSLVDIWPSANWYEREAFDLFGILFVGHPDLRRILTDYGFVGHPFRKDFPMEGYLEMCYDETQKRVSYQPVTIESREIVSRVVPKEKRDRRHG